MNWQEVCEDPTLKDLPYKIELNRFGQILMSPASNQHGHYQSVIGAVLRELMPGGKIVTECSIATEDGVRVADVSWLSDDIFAEHGWMTPLPVAPEICVEVFSPSNSQEEIDLKIGLYTGAGAKEVWLCDSLGNLDFRAGKRKMEQSELVPNFPSRL